MDKYQWSNKALNHYDKAVYAWANYLTVQFRENRERYMSEYETNLNELKQLVDESEAELKSEIWEDGRYLAASWWTENGFEY